MADFNLDAYLSAWEARDADRLADHYADDAELIQSGLPNTRGRDAIRDTYRNFVNAMSDVDSRVEATLREGNKVGGIVHVHTRFTDDMELAPGERIPSKGKEAEWDVAFVLELDDDGKITRDHSVVDLLGVMQQIGAIPEAPGRTA